MDDTDGDAIMQDAGAATAETTTESSSPPLAPEDVPAAAATNARSKRNRQPATEYTKSTVFVRDVPKACTDAQLEDHFGTVGPIKTCFIVRDPATRESKGFAFVQFSFAADAERVIAADSPLRTFQASRLKIAMAKHRQRSGPDAAAATVVNDDGPDNADDDADIIAADSSVPVTSVVVKKDSPSSFAQLKAMKRALKSIGRTVLVSGLLPCALDDDLSKDDDDKDAADDKESAGQLSKKQLYKKVRKFGTVTELVFPAALAASNGRPSSSSSALQPEGADHHHYTLRTQAAVVYSTPMAAQKAAKQLNGHTYKAQVLAATVMPTAAHAKSTARLLVRNIPFRCAADTLLAVLGSHGCLVDFTLPPYKSTKATSTDNDDEDNNNSTREDPVHRGFAFVTYATEAQAAAAMEALNGQRIGASTRPLAVDWALPKDAYVAATADTAEKVGTEDVDTVIDDLVAKSVANESAVNLDGDIEDDNDNSDGENSDSENSDDEQSDGENTEIKNTKAVSTTEAKAAAEPQNDAHLGTTVFVRNVAFDATVDDLRAQFIRYGVIKSCKLTLDRDTGRHKGTGFVQFRDKSAADALLRDVELQNAMFPAAAASDEAAGKQRGGGNSSIVSSHLRPETVSGFWLQGRQLFVMPALMRDKVADLKEKEATGSKSDSTAAFGSGGSRNEYLVREGYIRPDSEAGKALSETERAARVASFKARQEQLRKQPHLFVSRTRLSVRNLPKSVDEKRLREIVRTETSAYISQCSQQFSDGTMGRSEREEWTQLLTELAGSISKSNTAANKIAITDEKVQKRVAKLRIKQAKVVRDQARADTKLSEEGGRIVGVSKGYAFVEVDTHLHALCCLRALNNREVEGLKGRKLLVEFALENSLILKKRGERRPVADKKSASVAVDSSSITDQAKDSQKPTGASVKAPSTNNKKKAEFKAPAAAVDKKPKAAFTAPKKAGFTAPTAAKPSFKAPTGKKAPSQPKDKNSVNAGAKPTLRDKVKAAREMQRPKRPRPAEDVQFDALISKYKRRALAVEAPASTAAATRQKSADSARWFD